jgi:hypothetical protein
VVIRGRRGSRQNWCDVVDSDPHDHSLRHVLSWVSWKRQEGGRGDHRVISAANRQGRPSVLSESSAREFHRRTNLSPPLERIKAPCQQEYIDTRWLTQQSRPDPAGFLVLVLSHLVVRRRGDPLDGVSLRTSGFNTIAPNELVLSWLRSDGWRPRSRQVRLETENDPGSTGFPGRYRHRKTGCRAYSS